MTENKDNIVNQFNLAGMPSLPELLLREMDALLQPDADGNSAGSRLSTLQNLAGEDPFLSARLLALSPGTPPEQRFNPAQLVANTGLDCVTTLIKQSAARMSLARLSPQRLRFLKQLHLQALLSRALSEKIASHVLPESPQRALMIQQAGNCGLLLNIGALALEQCKPAKYLNILQQSADTSELLTAELLTFGTDHAEVGAGLLQSWNMEAFCRDAVRYHHHEISDILDATPLVKIVWLANQLADEKENPEAVVWADTLFEMQEQVLVQIKAEAHASLASTSENLGLRFTTTRYLPLPETEDEEILKDERKAFRQLRDLIEADNLLATVKEEIAAAVGPDKLGKAIASTIRFLFGPFDALLFSLTDDNVYLECQACTIPGVSPVQFQIRCDEERSQIASCVINNKTAFQIPDTDLAVIDQQIKSLLGADNFSCEPMLDPQTGKVSGALVLGISVQRSDSYKNQVYLRRSFNRELGKRLLNKQDNSGFADIALSEKYERRIKEAIHEVNNPLGIIKNYLQVLSMKQEEGSKAQSEIGFIKSEIDRIGKILETLKENPQDSGQNTVVDINQVVKNLVKLFESSLPGDIELKLNVSLDASLPELNTSEDVIRQIITNLLKNAAEACADGGSISVNTAGNVYMDSNRFIQLSVKDDGPGIAAHTLENLFVPGNSTKGGAHTGSGLAIVKNLVEGLKGQISCQTTPVDPADNSVISGTQFIVLIPLPPELSDGEPRQ